MEAREQRVPLIDLGGEMPVSTNGGERTRVQRRAGGLLSSAGDGPRMIPVGGGKGGVGKTFIVANLAVALARLGHRVVAVDADLEGPNLHTCVGVVQPQVSLADYVAQREEDLGKLLLDSPIPNLWIIAATRSNLATPQPTHGRRLQLIRELRRLPMDIVLRDLGAGTHSAVMDYFMVGDDGLIVISPEPTSVENAYGFLRAAFYRRLRLAMASHAARDLVTCAMDERNERGIRTPLDLLREIESLDPVQGGRFVETMRAFRPRILINGVRNADDVKLGFSVKSVCRRYYGVEAEYLGYVSYDDRVRRSVRSRRPLVDMAPRSDTALYLGRVARKLAELSPGTGEAR
jgi:flagellar biosynthesis protein FlhG